MEVRTLLKDLLIQKKKYSSEELRVQLHTEKESEFITILLDFLSAELKDYDFSTPIEDCKYLFKVFKYLELSNSKLTAKNFQTTISQLKKIDKLVVETIKFQQIDNPNEPFYEGKIFLDKIRNNIQVSILGLSFWKNQGSESNDKDKIYNFLNYLIYEVKNYNYLIEVFKTFPNLIKLKDEIGQILIDEIFKKYIELCKSCCDNYDIIYLEKVIKLIILSSSIDKDKEYQKSIINYLYQEIDNTKREKFKRKEEEKITFFINELINDLKRKDLASTDDNIEHINFKYGIKSGFSYPVIAESDELSNHQASRALNLTNKQIITIDCLGTSSYDDAFSIARLINGNTLLGVYISNVADLIPYNCLVDEEAFRRARTIYLPNNTLTMLPHSLAYNKLSLKAGEDRNVIAYFFEFAPDLTCVNFNARRAIINVKKNFTYDEADNVIENGGEFAEQLGEMRDLSERLKANNIYKQQYYAVKKIKRQLDDNFYNKTFDSSVSSNIVSEYMVLTNHFVANYFDEQKGRIPFIYRVNTFKNNDRVIDELKRKKESNCQVDEIIKCIEEIYEPSKYAIENIGHSGLNLTAYCHTTIPVRNYASIITQRAVIEFMIEGKTYSDLELITYYDNLNRICDYLNKRHQLNEDYQAEFYRILKKPSKKD